MRELGRKLDLAARWRCLDCHLRQGILKKVLQLRIGLGFSELLDVAPHGVASDLAEDADRHSAEVWIALVPDELEDASCGLRIPDPSERHEDVLPEDRIGPRQEELL